MSHLIGRRGFITSASALAGIAAIDPEELIWKPVKKIFIPPPPKDFGFVYSESRVLLAGIERTFYLPIKPVHLNLYLNGLCMYQDIDYQLNGNFVEFVEPLPCGSSLLLDYTYEK